MKGSGGRCCRKCEEKRLVWEQGRRWKVCAKVLEKAENRLILWRFGVISGKARRTWEGKTDVMFYNGTDCANTPAQPLSPPLVNEKFSEA